METLLMRMKLNLVPLTGDLAENPALHKIAAAS